MELGAAELAGLVGDLGGLLRGVLRPADLRDLALHGGHRDPVPAHDGRGARVGLAAAGGEERRCGEQCGGDGERGATAAVQRSLPRRLCGGAQSLAVIDVREWNGSGPLIRPTIREELGMWGGGGAAQPTRSTGFGGVSGRSMIVRETTNVMGMAAAAATSGA